MKRLLILTSFMLLSTGLAGCGSSPSLGSVNLICAGVESYESTKALALVDAAQGGSAVDSIAVLVGGQKEIMGSDSYALSIFDNYLDAMNNWASAVDRYQVNRQNGDLADAASELENQIDLLVPKCEDKGWKFENGWRG